VKDSIINWYIHGYSDICTMDVIFYMKIWNANVECQYLFTNVYVCKIGCECKILPFYFLNANIEYYLQWYL
jgi:hypothetical protein